MHKFFRISTLAALALGVTALTAQAQGAKQFGVVAGVDFSTLTGDDVSEQSTRIGFMGGLFFGLPVGSSGSIVIEPELLYSMKGTKFSSSAYEETFALDYIEIPLLVKYSFKPAGGIYILGGPAVGFNITCKDTYAATGDTESTEDCSDFGVKANTTFGGVLGLGFSKGHIGIEGRYDFDFGDAIKVETPETSINAKNAVWAIMLRFTK